MIVSKSNKRILVQYIIYVYFLDKLNASSILFLPVRLLSLTIIIIKVEMMLYVIQSQSSTNEACYTNNVYKQKMQLKYQNREGKEILACSIMRIYIFILIIEHDMFNEQNCKIVRLHFVSKRKKRRREKFDIDQR